MTEPNDPHTTTPIGSMTLDGYLSALNSKAPTPGGGAVAGTTGATAAAIAGMVLHYTLGKQKYADHEHDNQNHLAWISDAQSKFLALADEDAKGYGALNALWSLPESDPKRTAGWDSAVQGAINPPMSMLDLCAQLMGVLHKLTASTNRMLRSDLEVAAITCKAAAHNAACNIRINIPLLPEHDQDRYQSTVNDQLAEIDSLHDHTLEAVR